MAGRSSHAVGLSTCLAFLLLAQLQLGAAELPPGVNGALCNSASRPAPIQLTPGSYVVHTFSAALECQEFNYTLQGGFVATFSIEDVYAVPLGYHRHEIYSVMGASGSFPTDQIDSTARGTGASSAKTTASAELRRCGANTLAGLTRFAVLNTDQTNSGMQFNYTVSIRPCQGIITGIAPLDGPRVGGNVVTVTGEDIMTGAGDLVEASSTFHDRTLRQADVLSVSADRSTVVLRVPTAPAARAEPARSVVATVVSAFHGRSVSPSYTLNPDSYLDRITPYPDGPSSFAYPVVMSVTNLIPGDTSFVANIAGTPLTAVSVVNATALRATVPVRPAHLAAAVWHPFNATSVRSGTFTGHFLWNPDLTFESIAPRGDGPVVGGNLITVRGYGFIHGDVTLRASIGNSSARIACPAIEIVPPVNGEAYSRAVVITVPALKAPMRTDYAYDVILESVRSGTFAYSRVYSYNPQPEVRTLAPNALSTHDNGPAAGGLPVTLVGVNFVPGDTTARVLAGSVEFLNVTVLNATHIACVQPPAGSNELNTPHPVLLWSLRAGNATGPSYTWNAVITMAGLKPFPDAPKAGKTLTIVGRNFAVGDVTLRAHLEDDAGRLVRVGDPLPLRALSSGSGWSTAAEVVIPPRTAGAWTAGQSYRLHVASTRSGPANGTVPLLWLLDPIYGRLLPFPDTSPRMQALAILTGTNFVPEDGVSATVVRVWTPAGEELRANEVETTSAGTVQWRWPTFSADYVVTRVPSNLSIVSERWGELFMANAFLWNPSPVLDAYAPTWRLTVAGSSPLAYAEGPPVASGPFYAGNPITVYGRNFLPGPFTVFIDKQLTSDGEVLSNTTLVFRPPPADQALGAPSPVLPAVHSIRLVSTRFGVVTGSAFLYAFNGRTAIESALPRDGPTTGNVLTVAGTNFVVGSEDRLLVTLAGLPMAARVESPTRLLVEIPALPAALSTETPYDLRIESYRFGNYSRLGAYSWNNPARLDALAPLVGPLAGGNLLTLTGYNMADSIPDILSMTIVGIPMRASQLVSASPERVVLRAPNGISVGLVQVRPPPRAQGGSGSRRQALGGDLHLASARFGNSSLPAAYRFVPGTPAPDSLVFTVRLNYSYALFGDAAHDRLTGALGRVLRISPSRFVVLSKTEGSTLLVFEVRESSGAEQAVGEVSASEASRRLKALLAAPGGLDLSPDFHVLSSALTLDAEATRLPVALVTGVVAGVGGLLLSAAAVVALVAIFRRRRAAEMEGLPEGVTPRPINVAPRSARSAEELLDAVPEPAAERAPLPAASFLGEKPGAWPSALALGNASTLDARAAAQPRPRHRGSRRGRPRAPGVVVGVPAEEAEARTQAYSVGSAILAAVSATHWRPRPKQARQAPKPGEPARKTRTVFAAYYDRANAAVASGAGSGPEPHEELRAPAAPAAPEPGPRPPGGPPPRRQISASLRRSFTLA
eukprot:tig00020912_g15794.t1